MLRLRNLTVVFGLALALVFTGCDNSTITNNNNSGSGTTTGILTHLTPSPVPSETRVFSSTTVLNSRAQYNAARNNAVAIGTNGHGEVDLDDPNANNDSFFREFRLYAPDGTPWRETGLFHVTLPGGQVPLPHIRVWENVQFINGNATIPSGAVNVTRTIIQ